MSFVFQKVDIDIHYEQKRGCKNTFMVSCITWIILGEWNHDLELQRAIVLSYESIRIPSVVGARLNVLLLGLPLTHKG